MASKIQLDKASRMIKKDSRFKRLKKNFSELPQYQIPFDQYSKELALEHTLRQEELRSLDPTSPIFSNTLISFVVKEQSRRSRCAELTVLCNSARNSLQRSLKYFVDYVLFEYADTLKFLSTKDERKRFVESTVRPLQKYLDDVVSLMDDLNTYITNIDKGGFATKAIVDVYSVYRKNEIASSIR